MCNDPKDFCVIYYCEFRECFVVKRIKTGKEGIWRAGFIPFPQLRLSFHLKITSQGKLGLSPAVHHTLLPLHLNSELGAQLVSWARVIEINRDDVRRQIGHNRGEANSNESSLSSSWPSRKSGQARRSDSPFSRSLYPLSFDKISPVYNPRSDFYQRPPHQYHPRI